MGNCFVIKWRQIKKEYRFAFGITFAMGLLIHMYMITNKFPNHDYIYNVYSNQFYWPLSLGRCLLEVATLISSHFSLPWINGLLAIFYMAVSAAVIVSIFKFKNPIVIILSGGLLASYPALADTMGYMFTVDGYMLALFFSCYGVYLWENGVGWYKKVGFPVCIAISMGIYQSYISFAILLIICRIILDIFENEISSKELFYKIRKAFLGGIVGTVLYIIIQFSVMLVAEVPFSDYMGINKPFNYSVLEILQKIVQNFLAFGELLVGGNSQFTAYEILNFIFIFSFVAIYILGIIKTKIYKNKIRLVLLLSLSALIIPVIYMWNIVSGDVVYRFLMLYSVVLLYFLFMRLVELYASMIWGNICVIYLCIVIFNFALIDNIGYYNLSLCWQQTYALAIQMQGDLFEVKEGNQSNKIFVYGKSSFDSRESREWLLKRIPKEMIGVDDVILFKNEEFMISILNYDLGMMLFAATDEEKELIINMSEFQDMPIWPDSGAVQMINNTIVVKLND